MQANISGYNHPIVVMKTSPWLEVVRALLTLDLSFKPQVMLDSGLDVRFMDIPQLLNFLENLLLSGEISLSGYCILFQLFGLWSITAPEDQ